MSLPNLAPVSALEKRLGVEIGSLSGTDLVRAESALEDVSALVREEAGKTWVAGDPPVLGEVPGSVLAVVYAAALRAYRNPDGYVSENVGQGAYTWSTSQEGANGVFLTEQEKRVVRKAASGGSSVYTLRTPSALYDPVTESGSEALA